MDYFVLNQDERYANIPMLENVRDQIDFRDLHAEYESRIANKMVFYVKADQDTDYLDLLDRQLYLLSDPLKKLLALYEPAAFFKMVILLHLQTRKQLIYHLPLFEEIACLSPLAELHRDQKTIKQLVLQKEKLRGKPIIQVKESEKPLIVVRLDVAESLLRRSFSGIRLEKVLLD